MEHAKLSGAFDSDWIAPASHDLNVFEDAS